MLLKERLIRKWYHDIYEYNSDFMLIILGTIMNLLFLCLKIIVVLLYLAVSLEYCKFLLLLPFICYYIIHPWIIYCRSYPDSTVATMDRKSFNSLSKIFQHNFICKTTSVNSDLTDSAHLYTLVIQYKKQVVKIPFICYLKHVKQAKREVIQEDIKYYKTKLGVISSHTKQGKKMQIANTQTLIEEITNDITKLREGCNNG